MLQWLRLAFLLLVCASVRGREIICDDISNYDNYCWNSTTLQTYRCLVCDNGAHQLSETDEVIFINVNHTDDVKVVRFIGGNVTKMPIFIQKTNNKEITQVDLLGTNTRGPLSQFFGNAGKNLTAFVSQHNELSVEAFAFQNCKNLVNLELSDNRGSIIAPDAFRGLHKLVQLKLIANDLSLVPTDWFQDLGNLEILNLFANYLTEIPDNTFKSLTKLKELDLLTNKFEIITKNIFQHIKQLQKINLRYNYISQIQSGSFAHLSQLTELDLEGNKCVNNTFINKTSNEIAEELTDCYPPTCVIPLIPNGIIVSIDDNSTQLSGELFEALGSVKVNCNSTFTQIHDKANQTTNRCVKGNWEDQQWPTCQSQWKLFSS